MAEERLEIILEADVKQAIAGLANASNELKELGTVGAKNLKQIETGLSELRKIRAGAETAADLAQANTAISGLAAQAAKLRKPLDSAAAGIGNIKKAVGGTNQTLTNFGRVVQDAPFGIIGIANNIDPLIESFGRLRKETGSGKEAFKALGGALLGPAGIAVGISAATSALIAFGPEISAAIAGVNKFGLKQREAAGEAAEAYSKAISQFEKLSAIINDGNTNAARQKKAFEEVNSQLSAYGLQIEDITKFQKIGIQVGDIYARIKQEEAKSAIFAAAAAEEYKKQIVLQKKAQQGDLLGAFGDLKFADQLAVGAKTLTASTLALFGGIGAVKTVFETSVQTGLTSTLKTVAGAEKDFNDEANKSSKTIADLVNQLDKLDGVVETPGKGTKGLKEKTESVKALTAAEREGADFLALNLQKRAADIGLLKATNDEIIKITAAEKARNEQKRIEQANSKLGAGLGPEQLGTFNPAGLESAIEAAQLVRAELTETELIATKTAIAMGALGGAVDTVFNALANGENVFEALGGFVKQLAIDIAKAIVKALILKAVTSAIGGGGGGAVSGLIGQAFSSVLGGRAAGGPVTAGGGYIVGENGPEKFYPNSPGMIVPNDAGNAGGQFEFVISGNTLRTINRRADTSFGRLNG
jgi:hypothetical protein